MEGQDDWVEGEQAVSGGAAASQLSFFFLSLPDLAAVGQIRAVAGWGDCGVARATEPAQGQPCRGRGSLGRVGVTAARRGGDGSRRGDQTWGKGRRQPHSPILSWSAMSNCPTAGFGQWAAKQGWPRPNAASTNQNYPGWAVCGRHNCREVVFIF